MALRINYNLAASVAQRSLGASQDNYARQAEKLATGLRINKAGDDAAGMAVSERLKNQVRGLNQAQRNAQDGISMVQTAEGAMGEAHNILARMRELAIQASNDTVTANDRANLQVEFSALYSEIDRIASSTQFNGTAVLNGANGNGLKLQIGASKDSGGDTGSETRVVPWVSANYRDVVYLNAIDGLGWNAIKTDSFRAGLQLRPRFSPEDIEGLDLDRPDFGADVAAYAFQRLPGNIVVGGRVSRDVSDVSEGTEYYASVGHQRVTPIGLMNVSVYARGGDAKLADAYYGVSAEEAARNGIAPYSPGSGLQEIGRAHV